MVLGPDSWIEHATFEYQGDGVLPTCALELNGSAVLRNCIVQHSSGVGVKQTANITMLKPTVIQSCSITDNASHGVEIDEGTRVSLTEVSMASNGGYGLNLPTATPTTKSFAGLRECSFVSNASGGISAGANSTADAAYSWWGHSSGPDGNGPGTGQSIDGTGTIVFNPWFGTDLSAAFRLSEPFVDPLKIVQSSGNIHFHAVPTPDPMPPAAWNLDVTDSTSTTVFADSGSGTIDVDWDGTDGGMPPVALPNGTYGFTLTADDNANPQSILVGTLELNSGLVVADIQSPAVRSYAAAGATVSVTGTAAGSTFSSYVLEYGIGSNPSSWTQVTSSLTPVTNGSLGSFAAPSSANQWLSLRLRVNDTAASDAVLLKLESLARLNASPATFSPDGDRFEDATTLSGGVTWLSDWTFDVYQGASGPLWSASGTGTQISVTWDGRDTGGALLAPGNYTLRVAASPSDALSIDVTSDVPVTLDGPGNAIHITSPLDGALLTNEVPVTLTVEVDPAVSKYIRLEYGSGTNWYLIKQSTTLSSPFEDWNTTLAENGAQKLRATMHLEDGTIHQDEIDVTLGNLRVSPQISVFDPPSGESTQIDITNEVGLSGQSQLAVEVWAASTQENLNWEGRYNGLAGGSPVWSTSVAFPSGVAAVTWNGRDGTGAVVTAGEYVVRAEVTYAGGVTANYLEPLINPAVVSNSDITSASVASSASDDFDPFYGETVDVSFTLARPAWMTLAYDQNNGVMGKLLHGSGTHVFKVDGRRRDQPGLMSDGPTGYLIYAKASRTPPSMMHVRNSSITLADTSVEPIVVFPTFGQVARVGYTLSRESLVTVRVYQTVAGGAGGAGTLFGTYETDVLKAASAQSFTFDGRTQAGDYPTLSGTYSVEIVAKDSTYPSYTATARRLVRLLY
jgi:flagellar hook assembly protein FlgD